jgi:hypothetical protein
MSKILTALAPLVLLATVAAGCGGSGTFCEAPSRCSADPPASQSNIDQCKKLVAGSCGHEYEAVGECLLAHEKCGADNKIDVNASSEAVKNGCVDENKAYATCIAGTVK